MGMGTASAQDADCVVITDFTTPAQRNWVTVNDNVMGGRSSGGPSYTDSTLLFTGSTNTDGGGFSSIRLAMDGANLAGRDHFLVRIKPDARTYQLTVRTQVRFRGMAIAYRATLATAAPGKWAEARVPFVDLEPTYFGERVTAPPFAPLDAQALGIIINDKTDGPFALEVDWIKACSSPQSRA